MSKITKYSSLTNFDIEKTDKETYLVIPAGSVEAHGHHLSMNNDNHIADFLSKEVCKNTGAILCEPLLYGTTTRLSDFPGSINVRQEILSELLIDILNSYKSAGFKNILIINAHTDNNEYIESAVKMVDGMNIKFALYKRLATELRDETYGGEHSNRLETEIAMLAQRSSVDLAKAQNEFREDKSVFKNKFPRSHMPNCIDGYPEKANETSAQKVAGEIIAEFAKMMS